MANYSFDENGNLLPPKSKSVTEINEYIKWLIDGEAQLQDIYVVGELSNFKKHTSGHCYFSMKDQTSEIRCVMFSSSARKLGFKPENGMKILVHARVSVYPQGGSYQLYVDDMQPDGLGALYLAFEQLKEKLFKEGLFDEVNKKAIPKYASRIGVITSPTGAAIRDIVNVSTRRYPCVNLILYPTLVQGPDASKELVKAIEYFDITDSVDVIIIGRGGGSIEDLWAFNDEELARAIYKCHIPVISGVGHEIDFTICDYVSDVRAATPSAAAEIATPDIREIINTLENFSFRAQNSFIGRLNDYKYQLNKLRSSKVFAKPENMLDIPKMRLDSIGENLISAMKTIQGRERERFAEINAKLAMLNPMAVIARGYGAIFNSNGKIIKSINDTIEKDLITIKVSDGEIKATVNSREEDDNNG